MYAVLEIKGHQYIVKQGDQIVVDNMGKKEGEEITIDTVLASFDEEGKNVKLGTPFLKGSTVLVKIVENKKGEKIHVGKFKRKTRYERRIGFRPLQTVLKIEKVSV